MKFYKDKTGMDDYIKQNGSAGMSHEENELQYLFRVLSKMDTVLKNSDKETNPNYPKLLKAQEQVKHKVHEIMQKQYQRA